jgi:Pup-ligase protein
MRSMLMGVETEFGFTAFGHGSEALSLETYLKLFMGQLHDRWPHLQGTTPWDVFLGNGARLYVDCSHPEFATPECSSPEECVTYVRTGERMLADAARALQQANNRVTKICVFKCNVDYHDRAATWGSHESYLHRQEGRGHLADQLIPHLVSRIVYSGAGGLDPRTPQIAFSLSPRVAHIVYERSDGSTRERGIFHNKNETLSGGRYNRLHVICGESLCSHLADYLRLGTTALVVALIEGGVRPGDGAMLARPLEAMRAFAADTSVSQHVPLAGGALATAIDIQRHYLRHAERHVGAPFMPAWTPEVCARWCEILDALESNPASLSSVLDWPMKLAVFQDHARKRNIDWASAIGTAHLPSPPPVEPSLEGGPELTTFRQELCEIDTRFGQLGDGIFARLERAGVLHHRLVSDETIAGAMEEGPEMGRGRTRSLQVRALAREGYRYRCGWQFVTDKQDKRSLDLSDPFEAAPSWREPTRPRPLAFESREGDPAVPQPPRVQRNLFSDLLEPLGDP